MERPFPDKPRRPNREEFFIEFANCKQGEEISGLIDKLVKDKAFLIFDKIQSKLEPEAMRKSFERLQSRHYNLRLFLDDIANKGFKFAYGYAEESGTLLDLIQSFNRKREELRYSEKGFSRIIKVDIDPTKDETIYDYLWFIVVHTLVVYLEQEGTEKLHQCLQCRNFFTAQTLRAQRFCSDSCRLQYHYQEKKKSIKNR